MKNFWDEWALKMKIMTSSMTFSRGNVGVIGTPIRQLTGHLWYCTVNSGLRIKSSVLQRRAQYVDLWLDFFPFWHLLKTSYNTISHRNFVGIVWKISGIPRLQLIHFSRLQIYPACESRWWQVMLCGKGTKQNFIHLKDNNTFIIFGFKINSNNKTNTELAVNQPVYQSNSPLKLTSRYIEVREGIFLLLSPWFH